MAQRVLIGWAVALSVKCGELPSTPLSIGQRETDSVCSTEHQFIFDVLHAVVLERTVKTVVIQEWAANPKSLPKGENMIPDVTNIAQAAKHDGLIVREVDLSMRLDTGWACAGRFTTYAEEDDNPRMGYWISHAVESDMEWKMDLAIVSGHDRLFEAADKIHINDDRFHESLLYLMHGTTDLETIAGIIAKEKEEEE